MTDISWIDQLPKDSQKLLLGEVRAKLAQRRLESYVPYPKQLEFHEAGSTSRERLLMAANQVGKTAAAAAETAMHLTGRYPDWWRGKRFHQPTQFGVASETGLLTRDGVQRMLFGTPASDLGTGMIPKDAIVEVVRSKFGPADLYEMARIRHGGGGDVQAGESVVYLRSYDQGRARVQAMTLTGFWLDEEPPFDYYMEALTRTNVALGPVYLTFTPLKGMSEVVKRFLIDQVRGTAVISMGIEDAAHFSPEARQSIIDSYPLHERQARAYGKPIMGSGLVFPVERSLIEYQTFAIPQHWPRICGLDFGFDHPTAAVWIAMDRDTDTLYVYDHYRVRQGLVPIHAAALRARGSWIPVSWPADGLNDTAVGPQLAGQYRDQGIPMLPEHAQFPQQTDRASETAKSRVSVEAGLSEMLTRMMTGRFKVAAHLNDWWEEFGLYHRKDGRVVKVLDDLMSATRYAMMSERFAQTPPAQNTKAALSRPFNWRAG